MNTPGSHFRPAIVARIPLNEAMARYQRGDKLAEMAADYKVSETTVLRHLTAAGAPVRKKAKRKKNKPRHAPTVVCSNLCGDCKNWLPDVPIADWGRVPRVDDGFTLPIRDGRCGRNGERRERCDRCEGGV